MSECTCDEFEDTSEDAMDTALIRAVLHVRKHEQIAETERWLRSGQEVLEDFRPLREALDLVAGTNGDRRGTGDMSLQQWNEPVTLVAEQSPDYWPNGPLWDWPAEGHAHCDHSVIFFYWVRKQFPLTQSVFCGLRLG